MAAESVWAERPSNADLPPYYPERTDGPHDMVAHIRCAVADDGRLSGCVIASESPTGYGFGKWALALAPKFRATPEAARKMGGFVTIPIRSTLGAEPPARPARFQVMAAYKHLGDAGPYYPDRALRAGVTSVVRLDCLVDPTSRLRSCKVVEAANREYGFDVAVLKMVERGRMTAGPAPEGVAPPADGFWRFKVVFEGRRR